MKQISLLLGTVKEDYLEYYIYGKEIITKKGNRLSS